MVNTRNTGHISHNIPKNNLRMALQRTTDVLMGLWTKKSLVLLFVAALLLPTIVPTNAQNAMISSNTNGITLEKLKAEQAKGNVFINSDFIKYLEDKNRQCPCSCCIMVCE